jgi:archaellum biogenesis ATPase FlaH
MKMFKLSEAPEIPPRKYLIEGLIYKGEISLLYGPSGSGKSAIIEDMFTRAAAGLAVGRLQAQELDVYWFATENPHEHFRRVAAMDAQLAKVSQTHGQHYLTYEQLTLVGDGARIRMKSLADLLRHDDACRPQVIVIDTLNQAMAGMDENGSAGMSEVISNLKFLLSLCPDIHIMIVHHSGKKKENGPRGHSSLFAAMDTCFFISSLKNNSQLEVTKNRGGPRGKKIKFNLSEVETSEGTTVGVTYC